MKETLSMMCQDFTDVSVSDIDKIITHISKLIRKPQMIIPKLNKNGFHMNLSTPFQEILYSHFSNNIKSSHVFEFM